MSRLRINSKKFKEYHQNRLDEKNHIVKEKLQEEQRKLKEKNKKEEIKIIFESNKSDWRKEINLQESDWTPVAGSIANATAQTFSYSIPNFQTDQPNTVTVSGLGGVESVPSTVTVDFGFGETENVPGPNYSQLGLQGYAPPLGGVQRQTKQTENERIDAEIIKLEEQIKQLQQKISDLGEEQIATEPQYTGMSHGDYIDKTNEINDKWNEKTGPLGEIIYGSSSDSEKKAAYAKLDVYERARIKELDALDAQYKNQTEASAKAQNDHFAAYTAKIDSALAKQEVLRVKIAELEKQRPINQQLDAAQQAYPNLPFMGGRVQGVAQQPSFNIAQVASTNLSGLINKVKSVVASLPYKQEIAQSILSNKPIDIPQSQIPKKQIRELINGIENSPGILGNLGFSYTDKPVPYSDDNFYELPNGEVRTHTPETLDLYPNNTVYVGSSGEDGSNPLAGAGNAQLQLVHPKGGQPYIKYRDHAYHNLKSTDSGEVPDIISQIGSDLVHGLAGHSTPIRAGTKGQTSQVDTTTPNTGAMRHYPSSIRGDVSKTIKIPYDQFPPKLRKAVDDEIRRRGQQPVATSQASSLASQASSAVGLNPKQKKGEEEVRESTTWSRLKKHR